MSAITDALTRWGALTSSDLYARVAEDFGGKRSFERALADTSNLLRFGSTRQRAYGLRREEVQPAPLWMRDQHGNDACMGQLVAMPGGQWAMEAAEGAPPWLALGHLAGVPGVFQGLPWFVEPFRPAGFLGRTWVREHARKHGWPQDVNAWTDDQVIRAALEEPWDWRGNLSIGPIVDMPAQLVAAASRRHIYAQRADQVMLGVVVGASADGEQPKFTAVVDEGHAQRPVIVKFSPRLTTDPAGRRWADVMVTEAIASQVLTLHGMEAASTEMWLHDDRLWLETTRFDRISHGLNEKQGRRGMVSLRALAQTYNYRGPQSGWVEAARHLQRHGVVTSHEVERTTRVAAIGHLLSNNDMHMGNLSFLLPADNGSAQLTLAPVYDMTPMRWIPSATTGAIPILEENDPLYRTDDVEALRIAQEIWVESSRHPHVSDEWRTWAAHRAAQIGTVLPRVS